MFELKNKEFEIPREGLLVKDKERYVLFIRCFLFFWFGNLPSFFSFFYFSFFHKLIFFNQKRYKESWLCKVFFFGIFFLFVRMQYPNAIDPIFSTQKWLFQNLKWLYLKWLSPEKNRPDKKIKVISLKKPSPEKIKR